jgi:hypothetical protein
VRTDDARGMKTAARAAAAAGFGIVAAVGTYAAATTPARLQPGRPGWSRCVAGAGADGAIAGGVASLAVPGIDRGVPAQLRLDVEGGPADVAVSVDRGAPVFVRVAGRGLQVVALPVTRVPGLIATLRTSAPGTPLRLRAVEIASTGPGPWLPALLTGAAAAGLAALLLSRLPSALALALACWGAGLGVAASFPLLLLWSLPSEGALARVALPAALLLAGAALAAQRGQRRRFVFGATLLAAAVFGAWVRAYFLPSAGSWDVDYWKACALRTASQGVSRAYGDPDSVPPGHFRAQLRGDEPAWELPAFGRTFVIDQPPGIMLLWKTSWRLMSRFGGALTSDEALNVAAKLPPVLGDLLAVGVLLWAFGGATRTGLTLAALYWALPVSWLSSGVLGFFDGTYVALAVAALIAAGRGRAVLAGALLALAALVKSLALLIAPAVAVALFTSRARISRAVGVGLAIVALALVPFVLDGTVPAAVIHIYRIIFQERLSGGYGNAWWILSHALTLGTRAWTDAIPFVRIEVLPFPVRPLGSAAFLLVAIYVARLQLRAPGPHAAALSGAVLVLTYGQLAVGIHENHPHAFVLALIATGLATRRLRLLAAVFLTTYVLNMLALGGIGRFYTTRYLGLEPVMRAAAAVRMGLGFDITLALAIANVAAFAVLLIGLKKELEAASALQAGATRSPASQSAPALASSPAEVMSTGGNSSR